MNKKTSVVGYIIGFIFLAIALIVVLKINSLRLEKLHKEFVDIRTEKNVHGFIWKIKEEKGGLFITLTNFKKMYIPPSRNHKYDNFSDCSLAFFLKINDSIYKPNGTDSLYVFRGTERFYFIINKDINRQSTK